MNWFCDECIAKKVRQGKVRPLCDVYLGGEPPFRYCMDGFTCALCGKGKGYDAVVNHPDMEQFLNKENKNGKTLSS